MDPPRTYLSEHPGQHGRRSIRKVTHAAHHPPARGRRREPGHGRGAHRARTGHGRPGEGRRSVRRHRADQRHRAPPGRLGRHPEAALVRLLRLGAVRHREGAARLRQAARQAGLGRPAPGEGQGPEAPHRQPLREPGRAGRIGGHHGAGRAVLPQRRRARPLRRGRHGPARHRLQRPGQLLRRRGAPRPHRAGLEHRLPVGRGRGEVLREGGRGRGARLLHHRPSAGRRHVHRRGGPGHGRDAPRGRRQQAHLPGLQLWHGARPVLRQHVPGPVPGDRRRRRDQPAGVGGQRQDRRPDPGRPAALGGRRVEGVRRADAPLRRGGRHQVQLQREPAASVPGGRRAAQEEAGHGERHEGHLRRVHQHGAERALRDRRRRRGDQPWRRRSTC